jgi:isochorismate synthase
VLGRSVVVSAEIPTDAFDVAAQLGVAYPQCYAFAWQAGPATFVGASPELLLDKAADIVRLNPLAGSARRGEGQAEDARLAQELMASEKDRHEHRLVVDDVARRLQPLAGALEVPAGPSLRRLATVQHLSTEIRAQLRDDTSVFELLDVLHPTPAVGGTPRAEAVAFIDKVEGLDRGWYSGGIGWLTPGGDCRLALSLRCGLLRGASARLFAGAGIVADSDPDAELVETRLKFRPLLELLAAT